TPAVCVLVFSLMTCHPPAPPLCPYTTLFRSTAHRWRPAAAGSGRTAAGCTGSDRAARSPAEGEQFSADATAGAGRRHLHEPAPGDRKSTRLNSSHVKISYAVFCLKKKNKKQQ